MHKRMREENKAKTPERNSQKDELQDCEGRILRAECDTQEWHKTKSARRSRRRSNGSLKNKLHQDFEQQFENEAQEIFHFVPLQKSDISKYETIERFVPGP